MYCITRNSGHYTPFFPAPVEGSWPSATLRELRAAHPRQSICLDSPTVEPESHWNAINLDAVSIKQGMQCSNFGVIVVVFVVVWAEQLFPMIGCTCPIYTNAPVQQLLAFYSFPWFTCNVFPHLYTCVHHWPNIPITSLSPSMSTPPHFPLPPSLPLLILRMSSQNIHSVFGHRINFWYYTRVRATVIPGKRWVGPMPGLGH